MSSFEPRGPIHVETPLGQGYIFYVTENGFLENDEVAVILMDGHIRHFNTGQLTVYHNGTYNIRWNDAIANLPKKRQGCLKVTPEGNKKPRRNHNSGNGDGTKK